MKIAATVLLGAVLISGVIDRSNAIAAQKKSTPPEKTAPPAEETMRDGPRQRFSAYEEPFDYRDLKLGSTVTEFKSAEDLRPVHKDFIKNTEQRAEPACTGELGRDEVLAGLSVYGEMRQNGGIKCAWVHQESIGKTKTRISVAGYSTDRYDFEFLKLPDDTEPKLFRISLRPHSNAFSSAVEGLTQKYGPPTETSEESIQNRMGAVFKNIISTWENKVSRVSAYRYGTDLNTSVIRFELKQYTDYAEKLRRELKAKEGPGI